MYEIYRSILPSVTIVDIVDFEPNVGQRIPRGDGDYKVQMSLAARKRGSPRGLTDVKTSK
jgi:hypothetical protein